MKHEIEMKFRVADLAAAREALLRAGGEFLREALRILSASA